MTWRAVGLCAVACLAMVPALAAGIAVLTKAEPGLSQAGHAIWYCTYVVENRETTVVSETSCPPSIEVR